MPVSKKSPGKESMMDNHSISQEKNIAAQTTDTTDNVANCAYLKASKFMSSTIITSSEYHQTETKTKSFIQQRVERLYGPGALAQGFYSPKKNRTQDNSVLCERSNNTLNNYSHLASHSDLNNKTLNKIRDVEEDFENLKNSADLPVMRHLRPEFRAQLPILSPKKSLPKISHEANLVSVKAQYSNGNEKTEPMKQIEKVIIVDNGNVLPTKSLRDKSIILEEVSSISDIKDSSPSSESLKDETMTGTTANIGPEKSELQQRDGNYFLDLLKTEQDRLLRMAAGTEKDMEKLMNTDVPEEVFGYLRSASGKARLLASQKMKQFEGLCKNNLNRSPGEKFPTTNEDLQGFWDMVTLQIENVDWLFIEIDNMRANNWKKIEPSLPPPTGSKLFKRPNTSGTSKSTKTKADSLNKSSAAVLAAQKREVQRKQLMELKRKHKAAITTDHQQQNSNTVEIFVTENCS